MSNGLTAAKVAERLGVGRSTVNLWCRQGRFPSAHLADSPLGSYWIIPESDLKDFKLPKRGRTPKPKDERTSSQNGKVKVTSSKRGSKK